MIETLLHSQPLAVGLTGLSLVIALHVRLSLHRREWTRLAQANQELLRLGLAKVDLGNRSNTRMEDKLATLAAPPTDSSLTAPAVVVIAPTGGRP